jgi:hypothetical protein
MKTNGAVNDGDRNVPSVLLKPASITKKKNTLLSRRLPEGEPGVPRPVRDVL